jgi:hypothetical protein
MCGQSRATYFFPIQRQVRHLQLTARQGPTRAKTRLPKRRGVWRRSRRRCVWRGGALRRAIGRATGSAADAAESIRTICPSPVRTIREFTSVAADSTGIVTE